MTWNASGPAHLGADNVVRFTDADHFLRELAGNLGRGRAFVRTKRKFELQTSLAVRIEAPGVSWGINAAAIVVFARDGFVGLEFDDFENSVLPKLDLLGEEAARAKIQPEVQGERTVIAPMPTREPSGEGLIEEAGDEEERTGEMYLSKDVAQAVGRRKPERLDGSEVFDSRDRRPRGREARDTEDDQEAFVLHSRPNLDSVGELDGIGDDTHDEGISERAPKPREDTMRGPHEPAPHRRFNAAPPPPAATEVTDDLEDEMSGEGEPGPENRSGLRARRSPSGSRLDHVEASTMRFPAQKTLPDSQRPQGDGPSGTIDLHMLDGDGDGNAKPHPDPAELEELKKTVPLRDDSETSGSSIPMFGVSDLEDKAHPLLRSTPNGIVRTHDAATLLGVYLAEIRHGHLTVFGGPDGSAGQEIKLKLAGARVVMLDATITARIGNWVTLAIADPSPLEESLKDAEDAWSSALDRLRIKREHPVQRIDNAPPEAQARTESLTPEGRTAPDANDASGAPQAAPSTGRIDTGDLMMEARKPESPAPLEPKSAPPEAPPPLAIQTPITPTPIPMTPAPNEPIAQPAKADGPAVGPSSSPAAAPIEDDNSPPKVAKLTGDVVAFARPKDLKHEIDTNLKNGGLFVESPPLPLRTRKSLKVSIGGVLTSVAIEADVVFAASGRVGFSVVSAQETKAHLERALESMPTGQKEPPSTLDLTPQIVRGAQEASSALIPPFSGRIMKPLNLGELLDFQARRAKNTTDLTQAPVLSVFEYISRLGGKGVLTMKSGESKMTIYFHEGSAAYVESSPFDEATSLGRILIQGKRINESALREGLERAKQQRRSLGRVLVSLGTITKKVLAEALRDQTREKIDHTFSWKEGTYDWGAWREPPGDADLVLTKGTGIIGRSMRSCYESLGAADLEAMFAKSMGRIVVHRENIEPMATAAGLQQKDLRFIELSLNGERSISDAVTGSPIGRLASLRLIAAGLAAGMLSFKDGKSVPVTNVGPARSQSEKENPAMAQLKRDLKERLALMRGMNYFEVLGVHWSAHHRAYRAAYEKSKGEFKVDRGIYRDASPETLESAKEVLRILETAYSTLSDEKERVNYRKQLFDKTERQYSADMLVKQGEVALMRGDRVGAIEALETAAELDPSPRNRSLLGQAREGKS